MDEAQVLELGQVLRSSNPAGAQVEGRELTARIVACTDFTPSEAVLVGTLLVEFGVVELVDPTFPGEVCVNDVRLYRFAGDGPAQAVAPIVASSAPAVRNPAAPPAAAQADATANGVTTVSCSKDLGGAAGVVSTTQTALTAARKQASRAANRHPPVDPPTLLRLPPDELSTRLRALAALMQAGLQGDVGEAVPSATAIEWMNSSAIVPDKAQAEVLGNMLVNHGCLRLVKNGMDALMEGGEGEEGAEPVVPPPPTSPAPGFRHTPNEPSRFEDGLFMFVEPAGDATDRSVTAEEATAALEQLQSAQAEEQRQAQQAAAHRSRLAALDAEIAQLEQALASDTAGLAVDRQALAADVAALEDVQAQVRETAASKSEETAAITGEREELAKTQFLLEARQVKLLSELQAIYPIQETGEGFAIRALELPSNDGLLTKDDEIVSSALGYVAHLLLMLSKYLQVPLRYQLIYSASRSSIRDRVTIGRDNSSIYPLYRRGVDSQRFEKAIELLEGDIRQILWARNVPYDDKGHMLKNLNELFKSEICPQLA